MTDARIAFAACLLLCYSGLVSADEAEIRIVRGYEGMSRYADAASYADARAYPALYDRHVFQRYERECAGLGSNRGTSRSWLRSPVNDIEALQAVLRQIKEADVETRVREAATKAAQLLPKRPVTICIFAYPPDIQSAEFVTNVMGGAMGFADAEGSLWLQLLPTEGWLDEIYPAVTHEYYHAINYPGDGVALTLLDVMINEGLADSFAAILYPDFVPAWTTALSASERSAIWPQMEAELNSRDPRTIDRFVFGDGDTVPRQAGYTIGFEIVQAWLKRNPDLAPATWSDFTPRAILDDSGYAP